MLRLAGLQGEALVSVVRALEIQAEGLGAIRTQVAAAGGLAAQLRDIEEVSASHGDNHEMLMQRFFRKDRCGDVRAGRPVEVRGDLDRPQCARRAGLGAAALDTDPGSHRRPLRHPRRLG